MKEALVVVARAPRAGEVKTRLAAVLGAERTLGLYVCFLRDTFALMEAARDARPGLSLVLCHTPADAGEEFECVERGGSLMLAQRGDDFGARLQNCFADLFAAGYEAVVVMDADSPTLPVEHLLAAFYELRDERTVVLGPARDGGYYLIGLRRLHAVLFEDIHWGTEAVLAETRERALAVGLELKLLPEWYDVDTPEELGRLRRELGGRGPGARFTRAFLRGLEQEHG
jgi:uncharacterized protein